MAKSFVSIKALQSEVRALEKVCADLVTGAKAKDPNGSFEGRFADGRWVSSGATCIRQTRNMKNRDI